MAFPSQSGCQPLVRREECWTSSEVSGRMHEPSDKPETWREAGRKATWHLMPQGGRLVLLILVTINTAGTLAFLNKNMAESEAASLSEAMSINLLVWQTDVFSLLMYAFFLWALMPTILALGTLAKFGYRQRGVAR